MSEGRPDLQQIGDQIDASLRAGRYDDAAGLCREILRQSPQSVRPRCTLAWICIGKGRLADAHTEIVAYVGAARHAGDGEQAASQLRDMIRATFSPDLRRFLAEQLARLGHPEDALTIIRDMHADLAATQLPPEEQQRRIWRAALEAATANN